MSQKSILDRDLNDSLPTGNQSRWPFGYLGAVWPSCLNVSKK